MEIVGIDGDREKGISLADAGTRTYSPPKKIGQGTTAKQKSDQIKSNKGNKILLAQ